jgi:AcrR family transcriptional regulator
MSKTSRKSAQITRKVRAPAAKKPARKNAGKNNVRWSGMPSLKDGRREAILRSVANVLRSSRLSSLTIKQVADELGMTKGNLYYYFKDKQDILYHCHMRSMEISLRAFSDAQALGRTPAEKLRILLVRHIRGIIDDGFGGILQTDLEKIRPAQRRQYIAKRDELEGGVRQFIEDGVRAGEFQCGNVKLAGFAILGGINWIPKWYQPSGPFTSEEISEQMADYYLRGLGWDGAFAAQSAVILRHKDEKYPDRRAS